MDSRLYQASVKGDVNTLYSLIHEYPLILEIGTAGRLYQNPLHIAASVGHLAFTRELLSLNPNLTTKSDSRGRFPLHLASEKGDVEIVRELLLHENDAVCLQVDKEGRIPLHLAAMQGHVNVIMELIGVRSESINMIVTNKEMKEKKKEKEMELIGARQEPINKVTNKEKELIGETVLHLCVRYNRLEALKLLLDLAPSDSFVKAKDDRDGNTVLHLAAALKNTEAYWVMEYLRMDDSWIKESRGHLITTSTVIATVAFQAGLTPPGGVWQDDGNGTIQGSHEAGTSIMATKNSSRHTSVVFFNTASFATPLIVVLLLISGVAFKNKVLIGIMNMAMLYSIISMVLAYSVSVQMMIPGTDTKRTIVVSICKIAEYICYAVFSFVTLPSVMYISKRVTRWVISKTASHHSKA